MGRYLFISGCVVLALYFAGFTSAEVFDQAAGFLAVNRMELIAGGLLGVFALVCASLLFNGIGFFNILYVMAKAVFELIQLLLCAISLASFVFWFDLGVNIWIEGGGTLTIVLYFWLYGAALCLRLFDFNYPVKETLLAYSELPFVCLAVIWASRFIRLVDLFK